MAERGTSQVGNSRTFRQMTGGHLSTDSMNFGVPAIEGVREYMVDAHGEESWRFTILRYLHNHKVQYVLMGLLLLDVIILFIETFLIGHYPPCEIIERDCLACCPVTTTTIDFNTTTTAISNNMGGRFLAGGASSEPICASGYDTATTPAGYGTCDANKWHTVHVIEMFLFGLTITILGTFFVEVHLEMIAIGPSTFFRQAFYALDYVIILVSLTLELLFFFDHEELGLSSISGLIIFARIWRFVRIGHGIVEVTSELTHKRYEELLDYAEKLEAELKKNDLPLPKPPKSLHRKESHDEGASA